MTLETRDFCAVSNDRHFADDILTTIFPGKGSILGWCSVTLVAALVLPH